MPGSFSEKWFRYIHQNYLVYNTTWEDAETDLSVLELNRNSRVLSITGAGDNALAYLSRNISAIDCVDANFRQNALLDLKAACFNHGDPELLHAFFKTGKNRDRKSHYHMLRSSLNTKSRLFWDHHLYYFKPEGRGLYYRGTAGLFARILLQLLRFKGLEQDVRKLTSGIPRDDRENLFRDIVKKLWKGLSAEWWKSHTVLSLAGIPASQADAVPDLNTFMKEALYRIFVLQDPSENPYWLVYLLGQYPDDQLPSYLREKHFSSIREGIQNLNIHESGIIDYLYRYSGEPYSHIVLLDHMDWIAGKPLLLNKEWNSILQHTRSGSRILFRSAFRKPDFIPGHIRNKLLLKDLTEEVKSTDRVGTYTSTWLAEVQ